MHAGACNAAGHLVNTEDKDCEQCKADLYLFSVVSPSEPGRAVCPEHAALLQGPLKLLYRYGIHPHPLSPSNLRQTNRHAPMAVMLQRGPVPVAAWAAQCGRAVCVGTWGGEGMLRAGTPWRSWRAL